MKKLVLSVAVLCLASGVGHAETVYDTSLADLDGATYTTTTDANGTTTTSTGARIGATPEADRWLQQNVGGGATVGITKDYANNGNGSAYFQSSSGSSKADLEYYFSAPVLLSQVSSMSYDWFRDPASTNAGNQIPSLRLILGNSPGVATGYLIYEPVYNGAASYTGWNTSSIDGNSTFWSNNENIVRQAGVPVCMGGGTCFDSLADWAAANPTKLVLGLSTGIGSGWANSFEGAVDNISFTANGVTRSFNFEVAAAAVPEPATWAMMIGGFGMVGGAMRRRARTLATA